jgi:hypothetical protein
MVTLATRSRTRRILVMSYKKTKMTIIVEKASLNGPRRRSLRRRSAVSVGKTLRRHKPDYILLLLLSVVSTGHWAGSRVRD